MKNISIIFAVMFIVAGMASFAFADPDWADRHRTDQRYGYEQPYHGNNYRNDRYDRDFRPFPHRPVMVHRIPAEPYRPAVRIVEPPVPNFGLFFPNIIIQFR